MENNIKKDFTLDKVKYRCEVVKQVNGVVCVRVISPGKKRNVYSWGANYKAPYVYKDNDVILPSNVIAKAYSVLGFNFSSSNNTSNKDNVEVAATKHDVQDNIINISTSNTVEMYKITNTVTGAIAMFTDSREAITYCIGKTVKVDTFKINCESDIATEPIIKEEVLNEVVEESVTIEEIDTDDEIIAVKGSIPTRTKSNTVAIDYTDEEEEVVILIE